VYQSLVRTKGIWGGGNPAESSGQTVSTDQAARAEDANTQRPEPDSGTVDPENENDLASGVRVFRGGTGPLGQGPGGAGGVGGQSTFAPGQPGNPIIPETVPDDDGNESADDYSEEDATSTVRDGVSIPNSFTSTIVPRPNILSEFTSYSYSLSIYLMKPDDYRNMILTGVKDILGSTLLIQTGGIKSSDEKRNQFFDDDFYIDNFEMESLITGKSTQGAHNATRLAFDIIEPYGISFLDRLRDAVNNFQGSDQNMLSQPYLMVIQFYGYDEDGNLVRPENNARSATDSNAVVEKFIPFMWESIKFTIANQSVVYACKALAINQYVGLGQIYASVPYNIEISGQTIEQLFGGDEPEFVDDDDDNNDAIGEETNKTLHGGIIAALNRYEEIRAAEKGAEVANKYHVVIDEDIKKAKVVHSSETSNLANLPTVERTNNSVNQSIPLNQAAGRKYSIIAGQPLTQVLDLLIRSSTYITNQQIVDITSDPAVDRSRSLNRNNPDSASSAGVTLVSKKFQIPRGIAGSIDSENQNSTENNEEDDDAPPLWYKITTHINFKEYDTRRQEYAYDITYNISKYKVNDLHSEYFPSAKFRGVHKKYDYWFTGENTEVLAFEQEFNSLFYLKMAPKAATAGIDIGVGNPQTSTSKYTTLDISDQSEVMETGEAGRPAADAASSLYSPADQGYAELKVMGDPAWIQQSELFYNSVGGFNIDQFLPDDSINYDSQEPLFQLSFNLPTDYDVEKTGTMPIRNFNKTKDADPGSHKLVYRANRVLSNFSGGKFTQQISATLMFDVTERINRGFQESNRNTFQSADTTSNPGVQAGVDLIPPPTSLDDD